MTSAGIEPDAPDPRLKFVYEEAVRAIDRQAARLDNLRARSANLFAAGSIATGFLGAEAFGVDARPTVWAWLAAGSFVIVGMLAVWVLSPAGGWIFTFDVAKLQEWVAKGHTLDAMYFSLAGHLDENYRTNDKKLAHRAYALQAIVAFLVVEIVALFIDLTQRA